MSIGMISGDQRLFVSPFTEGWQLCVVRHQRRGDPSLPIPAAWNRMIARVKCGAIVAGNRSMRLELVWKNPNPPTHTDVRIAREKANGDVTGELRYLAYWGLSIFFPLRCVVFDVLEGRKKAA